MYNSPVLFFESATLTEKLSPKTHFVKAAIICDEAYKEEAQQLQAQLFDTPSATFLFKDTANVRDFIVEQKMGTCFYIAANWDDAAAIFSTAVEEGLSEEELQVKIIGEKRKYIYCMKCFTASEIDTQATHVQCGCGAHLEVGPFYSKVRKGYIGYPFVPKTEGVK
ncbi:hypothetical protein [Ureibacillus aquaedulcis]|uniref:Uncharacterized protein n=1 Tax=Ureibacillus aquaedulcis TaxID=3058421 RepID=A0ABT8GNT3_9BACL|nr:hypothetical protein [Ureibacillus sp. BA0131]MDN4493063.1 hypothetical protein [Ureibacillus sp. BA0131]